MTRYGPKVRGRGNVAPPPSYRPGQKARWLSPRQHFPRSSQDEMPFTLLTVPFDQSTPGFLDPPDLGASLAIVPPNSYVEAALLSTVLADQPGLIYVVLAAAPAASGSTLHVYDAQNSQGHDSDEVASFSLQNNFGAVDVSNLTPLTLAVSPCNIYVAAYSSSTPITTIAGSLVLKIYS